MASQDYEVHYVPAAAQELHDLATKARSTGSLQEYQEALKRVVQKLQTEPAHWGDPEYHPKKPGSCAYHAMDSFLIVRYIVYENERKVFLLSVAPAPKSPLA
jgi:hypothetical protein